MKALNPSKLNKLRQRLAETKKKRESLNDLIENLSAQIDEEEVRMFREVVDHLNLSFDDVLQRLQGTTVPEENKETEATYTSSLAENIAAVSMITEPVQEEPTQGYGNDSMTEEETDYEV